MIILHISNEKMANDKKKEKGVKKTEILKNRLTLFPR